MKVTVEKMELAAALAKVVVAAGSPTNQVYASVRLEAVQFFDAGPGMGDRLYLEATNGELRVKTSIGCDLMEEGAILIDAARLNQYVCSLDDDELLVLETTSDLSLNISRKFARNGGKSSFKGLAPEEFPEPEWRALKWLAEVPGKELAQVIKDVAYAAGTNPERPAMAGVLMDINGPDGTLAFLASDTLALSRRVAGLISPAPLEALGHALLPARPLQQAARILGGEETVTFGPSANEAAVVFTAGHYIVSITALSLPYPDMHRFYSLPPKGMLEVKKSNLVGAINRLETFTAAGQSIMALSVEDNTLVLQVASDTGNGDEELEILNKNGMTAGVALSLKSLKQHLSHLDTETVWIEFNGPTGPVIVRGEKIGDKLENFGLCVPYVNRPNMVRGKDIEADAA